MKCTDMNELITMYIDGMLDEHTQELINNHLKECEFCSKEYEELLSVIKVCKELPELDLPKNFEMDLHKKLIAATQEVQEIVEQSVDETQSKHKRKINWKVYVSFAAAFTILILSITSFNSGSLKDEVSEPRVSMQQADYEAGVPEGKTKLNKDAQTRGVAEESTSYTSDMNKSMVSFDEVQVTQNDGTSQNVLLDTTSRKIIKNAYINLDIEKYDEKFDLIAKKTAELGGYIENSNTEYKYFNPDQMDKSLKMGNLTIRVPEDRFISMVEEIKGVGVVTNFGVNGQDITSEYRDTVNEVENLKIQEERLRDIMKKATVVKDVLEVERELTRVRGDINRLTGNIKEWDELTNLSTIQVSLNEVIPKDKKVYPVSENVWEKAKKGFISTVNDMIGLVQDIFVGIVRMLPVLIISGLIGLPVLWYFLKNRK